SGALEQSHVRVRLRVRGWLRLTMCACATRTAQCMHNDCCGEITEMSRTRTRTCTRESPATEPRSHGAPERFRTRTRTRDQPLLHSPRAPEPQSPRTKSVSPGH